MLHNDMTDLKTNVSEPVIEHSNSRKESIDMHAMFVPASSSSSSKRCGGKRGRKPTRVDVKTKLERSRQSARECRARKKLRYQYIEELVATRDSAIKVLRDELEMYKKYCKELDKSHVPEGIYETLNKKTRTFSSSADSCDYLQQDTSQESHDD